MREKLVESCCDCNELLVHVPGGRGEEEKRVARQEECSSVALLHVYESTDSTSSSKLQREKARNRSNQWSMRP